MWALAFLLSDAFPVKELGALLTLIFCLIELSQLACCLVGRIRSTFLEVTFGFRFRYSDLFCYFGCFQVCCYFLM